MRIVILMAIGILSFLWGSSFIPIKNIVDVINPLSAFGLRFVIAGLSLVIAYYILFIIGNYSSGKKRPDHAIKNAGNRKEIRLWKQWILSGLFFVVGGQYNYNFYQGVYEGKPFSFKNGPICWQIQ